MSIVLENLRQDHACLARMMQQASFGGDETAVRVREPKMLVDALASAIAEIERYQCSVDHWRHEVGKLHSQIDRLKDILQPFAEVAKHDIGEDETDDDLFKPMSSPNNRAPLLRVGHLRRAAKATSPTPPVGGSEDE